ncbi:helix-turn-helix domain-containing protein [Microbulbifer sp. CAU 1566]|uniref:helix-turn-helix domain-containing protein n=1 Tax=Microbulbifer sp. CAU 1566 TaxID=2933269 RepID=UPI00200551CA|nr:helix-turn-helix domain-containing protein [Microbulbifer sp. CAU 1566]MCK7595962.1 helix-turn-helix domain-containing protein [Microbulbifer sp. CAU 1566]
MLLTQEITLHLITLVILFGIATGITLALLLFMAPWGNRRANRCLGTLLVVFNLVALAYIPRLEVEALPDAFRAVFALQLLFGPLLYFYCRLLTEPEFRWHPRHLWHLMPALVSAGLWLWQLPVASDDLLNAPCINDAGCATNEVTRARFIHRAAAMISPIVYSVWVLRLLRPYQRRVMESYSNIDSVNLRWLRVLSYVFLATAALAILLELVNWLAPPSRALTPGLLQALVPLLLSVLLGWFGLQQRHIRLTVQTPEKRGVVPATHDAEQSVSEDTAPAIRKSSVRNLSESAAEALWQQLLVSMEQQKPYLEPGLKIAQLAKRLDVPAHHLSETINGLAGQSFYDFINQYRVSEAARLLTEPSNAHLSVTDIGLQAGFNSNSTFFSQFKKRLGESPSRYRARQDKSIND